MEFGAITSENTLIQGIKKLCANANDNFWPYFLPTNTSALEYLRNHIPELILIDLTHKEIDVDKILTQYESDLYFHYGFSVLVYSKEQQKKADEYAEKYKSILCTIPVWRFIILFRVVLEILKNNPVFSIKWNLQWQRSKASIISNVFSIDNDPDNVVSYTNIIIRLLKRFSLINKEHTDIYTMVISELLMNAIEHGNCNITHAEKKKWLETHSDTHGLIRKHCANPKIQKLKVHVSYEVYSGYNRIIIKDRGKGFDWRAFVKDGNASNTPEKHGFGIKVVQKNVKKLTYNDSGNRVMVDLASQPLPKEGGIPDIFRHGTELYLKKNDVLIDENKHNPPTLYLIVSGTIDISKNGTYIRRLDSRDIFCGELSFLLGSRHPVTATIKNDAHLFAIGLRKFMTLAKKDPYYMLLIARIIASKTIYYTPVDSKH